MNNIVRALLRRSLVTDLARITHSLDLSSPHMAATVNSALKPLETLSRIVNIPTGQMGGTKNSSRCKSSVSTPGGVTEDAGIVEAMDEDPSQQLASAEASSIRNNEISTSEATNAYVEVTVDDSADNTDNDGMFLSF